jgi:O-antigen/teichoic acid export membrane protein
MAESLKQKTFKGLIWSAVGRFSVQGVQFLVMLGIARLLDPKDFGLVGMLTIFLAIAQSLIDCGFSEALIRKQGRTEADNCTVFYFNIVVSVLMYITLFAIAPCISEFYGEPLLKDLMRVTCVVIIINSFAIVQRVIYTAYINFRMLARVSFTSAVISGIVGVILAFNGYGVWTLVWQQIVEAIVNTVLLWWFSTWHPQLTYSWSSFRELFSFGSKMLFSGLLNTIYGNIYQIVIGKLFSASNLGYFTQAKRFASLPSSNIHGIIGSVTYPVLSSIQDEDERLADSYRKMLKVSAFIIFPLMCLLAGIAYPLVTILLSEKWNYTATLLIPLCFSMMWYPIHAINLNLLKVKGRSDLFLRLEIIKKILGISMLVITVPWGLLVMCYGTIVNSLIALIINTYYTGKLINVGFFKQMRDMYGTLIISLTMFYLVFLVTNIMKDPYAQLSMGIVSGLVYFLFACSIAKLQEVRYIRSLIKG